MDRSRTADSLKVTIGGEPFAHMVFEFILRTFGLASTDMLQRDVRGYL